jgi:3-hydroxyacyl-[acyl-carrier-protein] dehydratase
MTAGMTNPPDIAALLPFLPHRYPLPLVDRVLECVPGRLARGQKNVTINEPFFPGHFPGYPVMPGVLVIEALIQLCAILAVESGRLPLDGSMRLLFPGIETCRFKRQVVPGDRLTLECEMPDGETGISRFTVRAMVDGEIAAEAELPARLEPVPSAAQERR